MELASPLGPSAGLAQPRVKAQQGFVDGTAHHPMCLRGPSCLKEEWSDGMAFKEGRGVPSRTSKSAES